MVERDLIGGVDGPAWLATETETAISQAGNLREVVEIGRAFGGIEIAHHDGRSGFRRDEIGNRIKFWKAGESTQPPQG